MSRAILELATLAFFALGIASLAMWIVMIQAWWRGESWLAYRPRRPVPWGFVDVMIALFLWIGLQVAAGAAASKLGGVPSIAGGLERLAPHEQVIVLAWSSLASLAAVPAIALALALRSGATWRDLGLDAETVWDDLTIGGTTFVLLALPVYGLQLLITQVLQIKYEHPVTDLAQREGLLFFAVAVLAAVGAAPLLEELLFRVLFQGWLEQMAARQDIAAAFAGASLAGQDGAPRVGQDGILPHPQTRILVGQDGILPHPQASILPHQSPSSATPPEEILLAEVVPVPPPVAADAAEATGPIWPILVSGVLFALAHWGQYAALPSLFILGLGLGYLYQQTHRWGPSFVVHLLLNGTSMLLLLANLLAERPAP